MLHIAYLGNPEAFAAPFESINAAGELLRYRAFFDYAGGIFLPQPAFKSRLRGFPSSISTALERCSSQKEGIVYLRSGRYYLNFSLGGDSDKVRSLLPKCLLEVAESIDTLIETEIPKGIESKLMAASLLDHKKHYSMCLLNAFFIHMLGGYLDPKIYECAKDACITDISNFYQFLLIGKLARQGHFSKESLDEFSNHIILPKPKACTVNEPFAESSADKLIVREMDHPLQILFFAGHLLNQDKGRDINFVVNPLSGALEVGYAMRAIYSIMGYEKIGDIFLVRYSRHGEGHTFRESLEPFVPPQLACNLDNLRGKRLLIIDDNTFSGETLLDLKTMFSPYASKVGIAAIERRTDNMKSILLSMEDLDVSPISKLRYTGRVLNFLKRNNLRNLGK